MLCYWNIAVCGLNTENERSYPVFSRTDPVRFDEKNINEKEGGFSHKQGSVCHANRRCTGVVDSLDLFDQSCTRASDTPFESATHTSTSCHRSRNHGAGGSADHPGSGGGWLHTSEKSGPPEPLPRAYEAIAPPPHRSAPKNRRSTQAHQQVGVTLFRAEPRSNRLCFFACFIVVLVKISHALVLPRKAIETAAKSVQRTSVPTRLLVSRPSSHSACIRDMGSKRKSVGVGQTRD